MVKTTGGLLIKYSQKAEELFTDFLNNTVKIEYVADGANGIIYKLTCSPTYQSGYTYIDPNFYGKHVREIALKLCILTRKQKQNFKNEVNIQTNILKKTISHLQPLCPAVLHSKILSEPERNILLKKLVSINPDLNKHKLPHFDSELDIAKDILVGSKYQIGIIAMEYENGYVRLFDFINGKGIKISDEMKIKYINYGLFIILQLALETGYSQADFHTANIMINPNLDYFGIKSGRPLIIDFGYARKISEPIMRKIRELVNKREYISALKWLCSVKRSDNSNISILPWNAYYGWVCRDWDLLKNKEKPKSIGSLVISVGEETSMLIPKGITHASNNSIERLFELRESYKKSLIDRFNKLNKSSPINYPKLPLLIEIIRDQTYIGLMGGKKSIRTKTNKNKSKINKTKNKTNKKRIK